MIKGGLMVLSIPKGAHLFAPLKGLQLKVLGANFQELFLET